VACELMQCGRTYLYDLLNRGELEFYKEGRCTRIMMRSIEARMERKLKEQAAA
jgi:excisionase family DNA binding protein